METKIEFGSRIEATAADSIGGQSLISIAPFIIVQ